MKTVLLISNNVPHYRVSVYNYLQRRFADHGWELKVASNAMQKESKLQVKFAFHEIEFKFSKYRKLIGDLKPDAVILHLHLKIPIFWFLIHWLKFKRIPIISWTKGANLDRADSKFRYHLFNYTHALSDALILYSSNQTSYVKPRYRHKIFAANNTVNFEDYPEISESRDQIKAEFKILFKKVVLFVGTMGIDGERKRVKHLVEVFCELDRTDIGLIIVGSGMAKELRGKINPKNSLYLGQIHDLKNIQISKLFKAADIFVVPGHVGLGVNQAFYWGLPVITEDCLQPPEIQHLKSGQNGFIVRDGDLTELKDKMLYLLDNEKIRKEFSCHAREEILREASIEGMFNGFRKAVEFACQIQLCPQTLETAKSESTFAA